MIWGGIEAWPHAQAPGLPSPSDEPLWDRNTLSVSVGDRWVVGRPSSHSNGATAPLGMIAVAGHCRCASTSRGQFPYCAMSQSRANAGVGRPFTLYTVRALLSRIDSDPIQRAGAFRAHPPIEAKTIQKHVARGWSHAVGAGSRRELSTMS